MVENAGTPVHVRPRRVWPTALFGVIMLSCGAALGVGVTLFLVVENEPRPSRVRPVPHKEIAAKIAETCGLAEEQMKQVETIAARHGATIDSVRNEFATRMGTEFEKFRSDMKAVMKPEQLQAFDEHWEQLSRRGHGPWRGGPYGSDGRRSVSGIFRRYDENKDGKLTKDEAPDWLWQRYAGADANGDGALTPEEVEQSRRDRAASPSGTTAPAGAGQEEPREPQ